MDLVNKPRCKSFVWSYFGLKADERGKPLNSREAICRLCRKIVLSKGGNTTNLRNHLRRQHRADVFETPSSTSSGALFETQEERWGHKIAGQKTRGTKKRHKKAHHKEIEFVQTTSNQNYVADAVLPPGEPWLHSGPSRAVLSLPSCLCLCEDVGSARADPRSFSEAQTGEMKVYTKCQLQEGVMFGPYLGEVCREHMPANLKHSWAIREDDAFIYVDGSDENRSNWMRFVTYTSSEGEDNLVVLQFHRNIYYKVTQPIAEGVELRVGIGKDYATLLGLGIGNNVKCEVRDKEMILRPLQDIQLVTLPEPSSSSLWSDQSQSQSPLPVINDVMTLSNSDTVNDPGSILGSALPSSSPSQSSYLCEKYDFMPGTEKMLNNPNTSPQSLWYFFGFEPDSAGQPVDRNTVVCKLCGEHVGCGEGTADLQNHLTNKHHIRPRDRDRTAGQQLSHPEVPTCGLASMPPLRLLTRMTYAIANFLIMDLQPPALVEGEGFKQLMHTLLPSCKELPSPCRLNNLLKEHHKNGKKSLAQLLRRKTESEPNTELFDHTAPIEFDPGRSEQPSSRWTEVPHVVTLSVDIWFHNWQGNSERYLTLWAHYIDSDFNLQNLALTTQRLTECGLKVYSPHAVEAQVKAMAEEWGILQPNMILLGGEGGNKITRWLLKSGKGGGEAAGSDRHPNSTTFLEKDGSATLEEPHGSEHGHSGGGLPSVPCFFSVVQGCIEEVMSHPVVSRTFSQFHGVISVLFQPSDQTESSFSHCTQNLLQTLTKQEVAELRSWGAHSRPMWNKLYPLLSMLIKHKSVICDAIKEIKSEGASQEDTSSEFSSSGGPHANSTSNTSSISVKSLRSEWKVLEELCLVLKPLDVACRTLAKETFPRLSLIKPILTGLLSRHLVSRTGDLSPFLKEVKKMMRRNLANCYNNPVVNKVICVACYLDPQFHGLGFMEEKEQQATLQWLKAEAVRIVKEDRRRNQNKRSTSPASPELDSNLLRRSKRLKGTPQINFRDLCMDIDDTDTGDDEEGHSGEPSSPSKLSGMEFLLGDLFSFAPRNRQSSIEESLDIEMSIFTVESGASLGVEPLQWWRRKARQFPLLATVARAYLAAPAVAGNMAQEFEREEVGALQRKRANIPPESLGPVLFLHHNHMAAMWQKSSRNEDRKSGIFKSSTNAKS